MPSPRASKGKGRAVVRDEEGGAEGKVVPLGVTSGSAFDMYARSNFKSFRRV